MGLGVVGVVCLLCLLAGYSWDWDVKQTGLIVIGVIVIGLLMLVPISRG